jgi:hypothetical protein
VQSKRALSLYKQIQKLNFNAMSIYEFHYIGGLPWMITLSVILIVIVSLIVMTLVRGAGQDGKLITVIKQVAGFALAFGAFSTLVAFYQAFSDLEKIDVPFNHIMGGLKVALITTLYGFGIFLFAQVALITLKLKHSKS